MMSHTAEDRITIRLVTGKTNAVLFDDHVTSGVEAKRVVTLYRKLNEDLAGLEAFREKLYRRKADVASSVQKAIQKLPVSAKNGAKTKAKPRSRPSPAAPRKKRTPKRKSPMEPVGVPPLRSSTPPPVVKKKRPSKAPPLPVFHAPH